MKHMEILSFFLEPRPAVYLQPPAFLIPATLIFDHWRKEILQHTGNKKEASLPTKTGYWRGSVEQTPARRNRYEIRIYIQYRHDTQCHIFSLLRMEQLAHCVKDHFAHPRKASNCEHIDATQHIWKAQAQSIQPSFIASYDLSAHTKELYISARFRCIDKPTYFMG